MYYYHLYLSTALRHIDKVTQTLDLNKSVKSEGPESRPDQTRGGYSLCINQSVQTETIWKVLPLDSVGADYFVKYYRTVV